MMLASFLYLCCTGNLYSLIHLGENLSIYFQIVFLCVCVPNTVCILVDFFVNVASLLCTLTSVLDSGGKKECRAYSMSRNWSTMIELR